MRIFSRKKRGEIGGGRNRCVVGDASLLPSRIRIAKPDQQPNSGMIEFWDKWAIDKVVGGIPQAVDSWRKQTIQS